MKQIAIALLLAASFVAPSIADEAGGISGVVVDAKTGRPVPHAQLYYYRAPYVENGANRIMRLEANARGFFSDITLEPGRYIIMGRLPGETEGCAVDDVMGGEIQHVRVVMGRSEVMCSGPRVHAALVDPGATADVYRI